MGVKNFSKIFNGKEIKMKDINGLNIIVDASVIAYQASLCTKSINTLTDSNGNPTIHINVVIAKCLNFYKYKASQKWVFDYHESGYVNSDKKHELNKRKKIKDTASKKLIELKDMKESKIGEYKKMVYSSDEDDDIDDKINLQEKLCFSVGDKIINDIKYILDCFNIPWCVSPKGFEAEYICAALTNNSGAVWTTDADAIIYGAHKIIREIKHGYCLKFHLLLLIVLFVKNTFNAVKRFS